MYTENEAHEQDRDHVTIIVNGRPKKWAEKTISFVQIVELAFGTYENNEQVAYIMTYKEQGHSGLTMSLGDVIEVNPGMIFNVTTTNRS
ncbi:MAG: multiubiquitin domain-containing protein [Anaerolineaceae bacterium]